MTGLMQTSHCDAAGDQQSSSPSSVSIKKSLSKKENPSPKDPDHEQSPTHPKQTFPLAKSPSPEACPNHPSPAKGYKKEVSSALSSCLGHPDNSEKGSIWGVLECKTLGSLIYLRYPKTEYLFGKSSISDVVIVNLELSSIHMKISLLAENDPAEGDYKVGVASYHIDTPVYVNHKKVTDTTPLVLKDGDTIYLIKKTAANLDCEEVSYLFKDLSYHNFTLKYSVSVSLGQGAFANVMAGCLRNTWKDVAIKSIKKDFADEDSLMYIAREVEIMKKVSHPFITSSIETFSTHTQFLIVMELAPAGDLFDYIHKRRGLNSKEFQRIYFQLLSAIQFLHANNIVHRDIKPENVLLLDEASLQIKLSDFGLARFFTTNEKLHSLVGSSSYAAPEVNNFQDERAYTSSCDMWSLGVMMYYSLETDKPFDVTNCAVTKSDIINLFEFWRADSKDAHNLIRQLLKYEPKERLTANEALRQRIFRKNPQGLDDLIKIGINFKPKKGATIIPKNKTLKALSKFTTQE